MITTLLAHNYATICSVHRIGRTGRCGKTGIATTFINKGCGELYYNKTDHNDSVLVTRGVCAA